MTAVEWLIYQILKEKGLVVLDIQQALELEKQQIENAYDHYRCIGNFDNGIEYYNETYKKDNL
jgi:hypothetical protein